MGQAGTSFPMVNPVEPNPNPTQYGAMEVVVAELDPTGANVLFSSRIGSGGRQTANPAGLAVDSAGDIYLAGNIIGTGLITTPGAFQTTSSDTAGCCYHGFVAKIAVTTGPQITVTGGSPAVVNAATSQTGGIAPNEFITLIGTGLGPATGASGLTTQLAGSSVYIGGTAAYLTFAHKVRFR